MSGPTQGCLLGTSNNQNNHNPMTKTRHYTPELRRELVRRLYFAAKAEGIPMTRWLNRLVDGALKELPEISNNQEAIEAA